MNNKTEKELDEYRELIREKIDDLIKLEPDPLNRKFMELSLPLSYILSYVIKGAVLFTAWIFSIISIADLFKNFGFTHWIYFFISFCLGGLAPVILTFLWSKYISYDKKKRRIEIYI